MTGRRLAIRAILRARRVTTQEELRELLAARGHDVTQATLSRDLTALGARRVAGGAYEIPPEEPLEALRELVVGVERSAALVVVFTRPGAAQAVAAALDRVRPPGVLATIAGDDTIFVAPDAGTTPAQLARRLAGELVA